jgi:hypothetical protein
MPRKRRFRELSPQEKARVRKANAQRKERAAQPEKRERVLAKYPNKGMPKVKPGTHLPRSYLPGPPRRESGTEKPWGKQHASPSQRQRRI